MARYPDASWRPLKENSSEPKIKATQLILHSAVSASDSLFPYFNRDDVNVESHFYVQKDGDVEQYIDTSRQADANYKANVRAISVETWDNLNPDKYPWNDAQIVAMAKIAAWVHREHGVPLRRARTHDAPGVGGHTDFPEWSNVRGKTCPGLARRGQVDTVIALANQMLGGNTTTAGDLDMTPKELQTILQQELRTVIGVRNEERTDTDPAHTSLADVYTQQERFEAAISSRLAAFEAGIVNRIQQLEDVIVASTTQDPEPPAEV